MLQFEPFVSTSGRWLQNSLKVIKKGAGEIQVRYFPKSKEIFNILILFCRVVRYEDLCLKPPEVTKEVFKFFKLEYTSRVEDFLESHTKINRGN